MELIVNVTENWGIGCKDRLLVAISADLKRFRALTTGKTVILGRRTLATFPGGRPLKNRENIVLTRDPAFSAEGALAAHDLAELFALLRGKNTDDVCVIGGASVYEQLLPYCARARVTKTYITADADRFFPDLDVLPDWQVEQTSDVQEENGVRFAYMDYVNLHPAPMA